MLMLAGIVENSIVDGPGIRFTVFCQGCPHHCPGCQNESTWPFEGGSPFEPEDILSFVQKDPLGKGVTFSGGEPFSQAGEFARLARLLKAKGYEVASYTGYTFEELMEKGTPDQKELLGCLDILVDGRFEQDQLSLDLRFRGSRNQRILNLPASLEKGRAVWETSRRWVGDEEVPRD